MTIAPRFGPEIASKLCDMQMVYVFAAQASRVNERAPLRRISIRDRWLFGNPRRWVQLPEHRQKMEEAETSRLSHDFMSVRNREGRNFIAFKANLAYHEFVEDHAASGFKCGRQDVTWNAQSLVHDIDFDEFLYRLYAMSLDVFGDKAARDLYIFSLSSNKGEPLHYTLPSTSNASAINGVANAQFYLLMKELQNQRLTDIFKEIACATLLDEADRTYFSPVIALAVVLSPPNATPPDGNFVELSLYLEKARFSLAQSPPLHEEGLREIALRQIEPQLRRSTDENAFKIEPEIWKFGVVRDNPVSEWEFRDAGLTHFSSVMLGVNDKAVPQRVLLESPNRVDRRIRQWKLYLNHYIAKLASPRFHITRDHYGSMLNDPQLTHAEGFASKDLKSLTEMLPAHSSLAVRGETISIDAPGRKVLIRSLQDEDIRNIVKRRSGSSAPMDRRKDHDFDDRDMQNATAWNVLLLGLVSIQEALLQTHHEELSSSANIKRVRDAINDFDDFYDVSLFDLPGSAPYQDAFTQIQQTIGLRRQYEALDEKLGLVQAGREAFSIWVAVYTFFVTVLLTLVLLGYTISSWKDIRYMRDTLSVMESKVGHFIDKQSKCGLSPAKQKLIHLR